MEKYIVAATTKSPIIHLNAEKGLIEIKGRSTPEDTDKIYRPVIKWIKAYIENPNPKTIVNFHFEYFNSSSTKVLMKIINFLIPLSKDEKYELVVNWIYFDEDMYEYGLDFEELSGLSFNYLESDYSNINFNIKDY